MKTSIYLFLILLVSTIYSIDAAVPSRTRMREGELIVHYQPGAAPKILTGTKSPEEILKFRKATLIEGPSRPKSLADLAQRFGMISGRPLSVRPAWAKKQPAR
jgi:hypothetical protein